ncbi:DUF6349 family protein [Streptomyces sp. NPDC005476]|uniref:DUF6349 family protein n=1 Tax=Streptomyces sp. NPDC005476 TaxID=3156882 RepID=UPI003453E697
MGTRKGDLPQGLVDAGGPLRLYAEPPFDRHEVGAARGGFVLYAPRHKRPAPSSMQLTLEDGGLAE